MSAPAIMPDQGATLRVPGLSTPGLALPPYSTPQIDTPQARSALATQQVGDIATSMERAAMYSGEIEKHFKSIRSQTEEMHRATGDVVREAREGFQHPGYQDSPVSSGHVRAHTAGPAEGGADGEGERDKRFREMNFKQGREMGDNLSDLRANVARRTNRWMSEWGDKYRPPTNEDGQYVDEAGRVTRASARAGADWERGMSRIGRVQGAVNAIGEGEGLSGAITKIGGRFAGPAGIALGVGMQVNDQMIKQRKSNAFYQNIYGGNNRSGYGQRAQEFGFSHLATAGLMDSGEASELFRGVSSLGLQGDHRQGALDFATSQYRSTGMEVATSLQLIQQATENGVHSMTDFTDSLSQVEEQARKSGKSLKEAQEQYAATYGMLSGTFSNNEGTANIAGGLTAMQQGLGHRLGSMNLGGMVNSSQQQRMMASMLGMDPAKFQMMAQTNEGDVLGKGMNAAFGRILNQGLAPGSADSVKGLADRLKKENGGSLSEDSYGEIGRQLLSTGGNSPERVKAIAAAMGVQLTDAQVPEFIARLATGDDALNAEKALGRNDLGKGFDDASASKIGADGISHSGLLPISNRRQNLDLAKLLNIKSEDGKFSASGWQGKTGKATDAYFDSLHQSGGKRYKSIEGLIKDGGIGDDTRIRVKDKDGKDRDVTLEQAIKYHKDELEAGKVQITAGKDAGKTVGEVTGVYAKSEAAKKDSNTKVTVEAKGALKQFIDLQVSGGASVDAARRAGAPAPAFTSSWSVPGVM